MRKTSKVVLIIAASLLLVGGILAGAGYALGGMQSLRLTPDGPVLGSVAVDMASFNVSAAEIHAAAADTADKGTSGDASGSAADIVALEVRVDVSTIRFEEGSDWSFRGQYDRGSSEFSWSVDKGVLVIDCSQDSGIGWEFWGNPLASAGAGVNALHSEAVVVYPRSAKLDSLTVHSGLAAVENPGLSARNIEIDLDLGSLSLSDVTCSQLDIDLDMGSATLLRCTTDKYTEVALSMGDLDAFDCAFEAFNLECSMGSLEFSGSLTGPAFLSLSMGSANLTCDQKLSKISYDLKCDMGSVSINGRDEGDEQKVFAIGEPELEIIIRCSMGSIDLYAQESTARQGGAD